MKMVDTTEYEVKTREYAVYVSSEERIDSGSAVLFYPGGEVLFIFTCAHVVDDVKRNVKITLLNAKDADADEYEPIEIMVPRNQVVISPLANPKTDQFGNKEYEDDLAIIPVKRPAELDIQPTTYYVGEATRTDNIYFQGYPGGVDQKKYILYCIDALQGKMLSNAKSQKQFVLRVISNVVDQGNRVAELKGYSGAPVWSYTDEAHTLLGLIAQTFGPTALLSKVQVVKAERIRSLMKYQFGIYMERRNGGIADDEVAEGKIITTVFDGTLTDAASANDIWLKKQTGILRAYIDDLQLRKAIDTGKKTMSDHRFTRSSGDVQKRLMQHLLYCYEITYLNQDFDKLEALMDKRGFIKGHDPLRRLTRSFMMRKFEDTIAAADEYLTDPQYQSNDALICHAKVFRTLAHAYTEELPVEETIGLLVDEKENLTIKVPSVDDEALIYQMLGYVYGERYRNYTKSVRFLNRSYQIGYDNAVLESLATSYYFLGIQNGLREDDTVDIRKVDNSTLNKAREFFLTIIGKADDLYWAGTMRRVGLIIYNTFYFLQDSYRVLTLFPDVKKYCTKLDADQIRDVEMKYARLDSQKGSIDFQQFTSLTDQDKAILNCLAAFAHFSNIIEGASVHYLRQMNLEDELKKIIQLLGDNLDKVDKHDVLLLRVDIMNLYARGILIYGWDAVDKMKEQFEFICKNSDEEQIESLANFIAEYENPIELTIEKYKHTFETKRNFINWQELKNLYLRHELFDYSDEMFRKLFTEDADLIEDLPEYAYRAYIDYITLYNRNINDALKCYITAKDKFADTDIAGYWETELMWITETFNDPDRFEKDRWVFVERGLFSLGRYHMNAFTVYLANLNLSKTEEHHVYAQQMEFPYNPVAKRIILPLEEIHYLCLTKQIAPHIRRTPSGMLTWNVDAFDRKFKEETWNMASDPIAANRFSVNRIVCMDTWALYYLMLEGKLKAVIDSLDHIYIPHKTIIKLLNELAHSMDFTIRSIIGMISANCDKISIVSAQFIHQIPIRDLSPHYGETAAMIALGIEKECITVIGEPEIQKELSSRFKYRIIRPSVLKNLIQL